MSYRRLEYYNGTGDVITLRTMNYNVFGRWFGVTGYEGQDERLAAIPEAIVNHPKLGPDIDVITVEEAWCPDSQLFSGRVMCGSNQSRDVLTAAMSAHGWKYSSKVVDLPGGSVFNKQTTGGAIVYSKWPIDATSQYVFQSCKAQDCHAAKGVVYVRVTKKDSASGIEQVFNIFGTHLQAWATPDGIAGRKGQLDEIYNKYIPALGIPTDGSEPIIYQGDMNTDYVLYPEEVNNMYATLHAASPTMIGEQLFTSDPSTNFLVGKDGGAKVSNCLQQYQNSLNVGSGQSGVVPFPPSASCTGVPTTTKAGGPFFPRFVNSHGGLNVENNCKAYCPCCSHEMLDFILYNTENKYLQPLKSSVEVIPLKSVRPLNYKWGWCEDAACIVNKKQTVNITGNDLSDHYPVVANFVFRPTKKTFPQIDGCKNDDDCNYKVSLKASCYCTGPTCTYNNKKTNGWDAGGHHPINANCHFRTGGKATCFCRPGNQ